MSDENFLQTGQATQGQLGMCAREKYWSERNETEKIAALSEVVASLLRQVEALYNSVRMLERHEHSNGRIVTDFKALSEPRDYNPIAHYLEKIGYGLRS